ncbi:MULTISPECIES: hypothetical protein [Pacificibacter]|uniref:hypothetical protein n=1 Tax=Pacificibacter TaxID=1042323 RepID=UPI001C0968AD|nr:MULTISPECIES: hypothetical protein [Pacificibacter]MDO6616748.1 hypothetical protein [Pacificibacter sp. 1_MG-2023]
MSVSKMWSLAIGLFFLCVLASTLPSAAAMPKSAKATQSPLSLKSAVLQQDSRPSLMRQIPNVAVACAMPLDATHQIAQCTIDTSVDALVK